MNKISLKIKFLAVALFLLFAVGALVVLVVQNNIGEAVQKEAEKRGISLARNLATNIEDLILTEQIIEINNALSRTMNTEGGLSYIFILDANKDIIAHVSEGAIAKNLITANNITSNKRYNIQLLNDGSCTFLDIAFPIMQGRLGVLRLGISQTEILVEVTHTLTTISGIVALIFLFGLIISYLLIFTLIQPLASLTQAVKNIAGGDLSKRADVSSGDEIGVLAKTFNEMAANLEDSHNQLRQYAANLEEKVAVRTKDLRNKVKDLNKARKVIANVVDDLKKSRDEIEQERAKDEALLSGIGDGAVAVDKEGRIIYMNQSAEEMLGLNAKEIIGELYFEKWAVQDEQGKDIPLAKRPIKIALSTKRKISPSTTFYYVRKDKTRFPVAIIVAPVILAGEIIGVIDVFRDITKEKEVDKVKTEFVSLASHQLRTPLSTIGWYAEMLLAEEVGKINPGQKKYLEQIYNSNQRMVDLVGALLNVSRLDMGTFVVDPESVDVWALARSVMDELKPQIDSKKQLLKVTHEKRLPKMQADPKLLRMVFQNLLSNSVKYTPDEGKIKLNIHVVRAGSIIKEEKIKETSIMISVSDSGYGIPKSQQDRIFSKLFRADNVREKDTEGTGLGLYIVKAIVDFSDGIVWFESEENKGATFYVVLPLSGMKRKKGTKHLG